MNISAIGSLIIGFLFLIVSFVIESKSGIGIVTALLSPTSAMIVFGGTIGAVGLSFPAGDLKKIPKILKVAFGSKDKDLTHLIDYFKNIAVKTRREGLLSIEEEINKEDNVDPFVKKGLQLIVDGVEPQTVRGVLEAEAYMTSERHKGGAAIFDSAGGYSPTMGIIGTVMGLVNVLGHLSSSDSGALGEAIANAFIATLYGVSFANLVWLPIGTRLKTINKHEDKERELIIEAVLSIQEGLNPNTLVEKLKSFLSKDELSKMEGEAKTVGEKVEA